MQSEKVLAVIFTNGNVPIDGQMSSVVRPISAVVIVAPVSGTSLQLEGFAADLIIAICL